MKRLGPANDKNLKRQIARTREFWQPRIGRQLPEEDARQMLHSVTGFFGLLAEWRRAESCAAANDCATRVELNDYEVRYDR